MRFTFDHVRSCHHGINGMTEAQTVRMIPLGFVASLSMVLAKNFADTRFHQSEANSLPTAVTRLARPFVEVLDCRRWHS
jgi:hypothetical protein